jgi:hypothetical protein
MCQIRPNVVATTNVNAAKKPPIVFRSEATQFEKGQRRD